MHWTVDQIAASTLNLRHFNCNELKYCSQFQPNIYSYSCLLLLKMTYGKCASKHSTTLYSSIEISIAF